MIILYILAALTVLTLLLLMTNVKIHVRSDGDMTLRAGAGPIMIKLIPKKKKRIRLRDFSHKKYLKRMEELRTKKEKKKSKSKEPKKKLTPDEKRDTVTSVIELVLEILGRLEKYTSKLNSSLDQLYVSVGGKDPSEVAVKFGVISSAVGLLLELLDLKTRLKVKNPDNISVVCDYLSPDIKFVLDVTVKIRILDALKTGIEILMLKIKHDISRKSKFTNTERQESQYGREQAE